MPTFRLRKNDGTVETVQAVRMRVDTDVLHLEKRAAGMWQPELSVNLEEVDKVQRRMTEPSGNWVWRTERIPAPSAM